MSGTLLTAFVLAETLGFQHTLWVAAAGNFLIAAISFRLGRRPSLPLLGQRAGVRVGVAQSSTASPSLEKSGTRWNASLPDSTTEVAHNVQGGRIIEWILFSTGFASMAMEVVWIRAFAPVVKAEVYSFALIVAAYLGATFLGSLLYRRHLATRSRRSVAELIALLSGAAFLPILANDPRLVEANFRHSIAPVSVMVVLASICPFCAILGYLTPSLVDDYASGAPASAGKAYALNVLGCILGPLAACYVILPWLSERHALILLGLPFLGFYLLSDRRSGQRGGLDSASVHTPSVAAAPTAPASWPHSKRFAPFESHRTSRSVWSAWSLLPLSTPPRYVSGCKMALGIITAAHLAGAIFVSESYEDYLFKSEKHIEVRRDYAASVICFGDALDKRLLVNGLGMTILTPITKFMVHLPLVLHKGQPRSALIICFGMGTTYRSALSWGLPTTTVELVPSVTEAFGFYHADAAGVLSNPKGHIVVDDGRRYLDRTREKFDLIVIDPPPPMEAAGCSLLYSTEFYGLARQHLNPNGILAAWFPGGTPDQFRAVLGSVPDSFPYMRVFDSVGETGEHVLASMQPIQSVAPAELAARLPARAKEDLLEWNPGLDPGAYLEQVVSHEVRVEEWLVPGVRITDDRPYNEYYLITVTGSVNGIVI